ncbi:MAG: hypothetical protein JXD22_11555 [Sedimentisphaerales bacterium]|nr:hypothetical protein [Sedimentisphaerales bacterium]
MSEKLLTMTEAASRLAISRPQFYRLLPELQKKGLQLVRVVAAGRQKVRECSLDNIIRKSAEREVPLVSIGPSGLGGPYQNEFKSK